MEYVVSKDVFDEARAYFEGRDKNGNPHERNLDRSEHLLNELLTNNIGHPVILYTLGSLHYQRGNLGLCIQLLSQVANQMPGFGEVWNNLGLAYADLNDLAKSVHCLTQAYKILGLADIAANLSSAHITRNMPEKALYWAEEGLKIDSDHKQSKWHKCLALLEMRRWDEAWDLHDIRLDGQGRDPIAQRNYHPDKKTPIWDGKSPGKIVIHGEQGMGDEIMFASCIPDALKTEGCEFIIEPSPRLAGVFKRAFPSAKVYGTDHPDGRDWIETEGWPDYKIALGSLPKFYRRNAESFPGTPYLIPDKVKSEWWKEKLESLGPRPNIGIAWQGGVQWTRFDARSFHPRLYAPLFKYDANFISLQYDETAARCCEEVERELGTKIHHWPSAVSAKDPRTNRVSNLDELVALISQLDLVITVCQTAVHVAGALGVPCLCLTTSEPSWRYGAGEWRDMPWYNSVCQLRQPKGCRQWDVPISDAEKYLSQFISEHGAIANAH